MLDNRINSYKVNYKLKKQTKVLTCNSLLINDPSLKCVNDNSFESCVRWGLL